jgi:hypothetical protein
MLDDFRKALPQFARRQGRQGVHVGNDQCRLMPRADQILSRRSVDCGFSPDGAIHLRQEGRRYLHPWNSAVINRGHEPSQISHHSAAERHDERGAVQPSLDHLAAD